MDNSFVDSGSYDSRKFILTIVGTALITIYSVLGAFIPSMSPILPTFIGGILGVLSLYFGINVANKYVLGNIATRQMALNVPPTKRSDGSPISILDEGGEV